MATTAEKIAALEDALARGVSEVQRGDERIKYRSQAEMRDELARLRAALSGAARKSVLRQMTPKTSRGL